jgi:membrane protease YdiL (CAAX protease family)
LGTLVVPAVALLPAFAEELGWRGVAAPKLLAGKRQRLAPLTAGLGLGVVWAALHLPLYLPGHIYDGVPLWPLPVIIVSYSVLLTWVFHAVLNGATPITGGVDPIQAWELRAAVFAAIALAVAVIAGPNLTRRHKSWPAVESQREDTAEGYITKPVARV